MFVIFSKMQLSYIAVMGFISIRKCACSQTPIVINADVKEQEAKAAIHPVEKKRKKRRTKNEVETKRERVYMIQ